MRVETKQKRKMTREEAGRKGGLKVARERGQEFYRAIGRKGGEKVAEERGSEFYRRIGRIGGESKGKTLSGKKVDSGGPQIGDRSRI